MTIQNIPGYEGKTATELQAILRAITPEPTNAIVTLDTIETMTTPAEFKTVRVTLEKATAYAAGATDDVKYAASEVIDLLARLRNPGITLSSPRRQAIITRLAGTWPNDLRDKIKALGIVSRVGWQKYGYAVEPTLAEIQVEIDELKAATKRQEYQQRFDAILNQLGTSEQAAGIKALHTLADEMGA